MKESDFMLGSHRSSVDNKLEISNEQSVISILRKPKGVNPEHAFLILESMNKFGQIIFTRFDLFINGDKKNNKAEIATNIKGPFDREHSEYYLKEIILRGDTICFKAWNISKSKAKLLREEIIKDQMDPPTYQLSGDRTVLASKNEGHSCFTWAREKLLNLNEAAIIIPPKYSDFIVAKTSFYLVSEEEPKSRNCVLC